MSGAPNRPRPAAPRDGIAWVTGAASGIGVAIVDRLVADGWTVAATEGSQERLDALAARHAGRVVPVPGDVTDENAMRAAVALATQATSRPVALAVLCASVRHPMGASDFSLDRFRDSVETNLLGAATALAAAMPGMIARRRGQIAITASVAGYFGMPRNVADGPTQAGLINLAESLRFHLGDAGVMVNLVCPGFIRAAAVRERPRPGPFVLDAERAAEQIVRGLRAGRFEIVVPRITRAMKLIRALPYALVFAAVAALAKPAIRRH